MSHSEPGIKGSSDREIFSGQLALFLKAGIPLPAGVRRFARELAGRRLGKTAGRIAGRLEKGMSLSSAVEGEGRAFPPDYIALLRLGERGGDLGAALELAVARERFSRDFSLRLKNAALYPLAVLLFVGLSYTSLALFALPAAERMLSTSQSAVPLITRIVLALSPGLGYATLGLLGLLALLFLLPAGRELLDGLALRAPFLRSVIRERFLASFCRGFGMLSRAGLSGEESLLLLSGCEKNRVLSARLKKAAAHAARGQGILESLKVIEILPEEFFSVLGAALEGGAPDEALAGLAEIYEEEAAYHSTLFLRGLDIGLVACTALFCLVFFAAVYSTHLSLATSVDAATRW